MSNQPHSAEWINDSRFDWWSTEQLASILQRNSIAGTNKILDVGVGAGHWSAKLAMAIDRPQDITGVDFEPHWIAESQKLYNRFPQHKYQAVLSKGEALPFQDNSFDIVTCQTVLMHCAEPLTVLQEMKRVLKPGGMLLLSEPMNHWNRFGTQMLLAGDSSVAHITWRIWSIFRSQKIKEGAGDNDIAATMPSLLQDISCTLLGAYQSERVDIEIVAGMNAEEYFSEYNNPENIGLLQRGGISSEEIEQSKAALEQLIAKFKSSDLKALASPMPLLLFVAQKPAT